MHNEPGYRFGIEHAGGWRVIGYFPTGVLSLLSTPLEPKGKYVWLEKSHDKEKIQKAADMLNDYDRRGLIDWNWCEEHISPRLKFFSQKG